jgi:site-specific DNA-methyltransferase (adenine-specific)
MDSNPFDPNTLYYGDNLEVLRKYFPSECIDLIYLDPPFNSKADYNILFKEATGEESVAQIQAFSDFWHWDKNAEKTYLEVQEDPKLTGMIQFLHAHLGRNDMLAYLVMMTIRLRELHRVLKRTGSLYLHCDPTASHYLKLVMDTIFEPFNFRNEIVWVRTTGHRDSHKYNQSHDIVFYYTKGDDFTWNPQYIPYDEEYIKKNFNHVEPETGRKFMADNLLVAGTRKGDSGKPWHGIDPTKTGNHWQYTIQTLDELDKKGKIYWPPKGKMPRLIRYLDELDGKPLTSEWTDIPSIGAHARERLNYPTQKPLLLLERIIKSSSNEGDTVLDPFCGCGTTILAAQELRRRWIGIDITHLAISLIRSRLREIHVSANKDYRIVGEPVDFESARELAETNPYQFQWWALSLIDARPTGQSSEDKQGKKGADKGIDGWLTFRESDNLNLRRIVVQVKGGVHIGAQIVRDLLGTVQSTKSAMGILITLHEPTEPMKQAAMEAEYYESKTWGHKYPKIQIITIAELLKGAKPILPHTH